MKKIPKIAHFYWDDNRLSYLHYLTLVSFHKFNPEWEIKLYTSRVKYTNIPWQTNSHKIPYIGVNYLPRVKKLPYVQQIEFDMDSIGIPQNIPEIFKSDILRWHLLSTEGGLWSDMDILYFQPMSHLDLSGIMYAGEPKDVETLLIRLMTPKYPTKLWSYLIGFMLSSENNPLFADIYQTALKSIDPKEYQCVGAKLLNSAFQTTDNIKARYPDMAFAVGGMDIVYAYPPLQENGATDGLDKLFIKNDLSLLSKNSIGIHWFNGMPIAEYFNNEYNHLSASEFSNTIHTMVNSLGKDKKITY